MFITASRANACKSNSAVSAPVSNGSSRSVHSGLMHLCSSGEPDTPSHDQRMDPARPLEFLWSDPKTFHHKGRINKI